MRKRELRKEVIKVKLRRIEDGVNFIEVNFPDSFKEFEEERLLRDGIYKEIEFAIQEILDICAIINSDLSLGSPETEDSVFDHIELNKILSKKIINIIRLMKGFRNILVHRYGEIDDKKAFNVIKERLSDFELIVNDIEKFLKKY